MMAVVPFCMVLSPCVFRVVWTTSVRASPEGAGVRGKPRRSAAMWPPSVWLGGGSGGTRGVHPAHGRWGTGGRPAPGGVGAATSWVGGVGVLGGGSRSLCEQVLEDRPSVGRGGKLRHVGDAGGQAHGGGAGAKQAPKPGRRVATGLVVVEGEEDPRAAPQSGGHPLKALRPQGGAGGQAPLRQDKPVEDALGDDRPRGAGPSRPRPSTGLGPGSDWNRGDRSGSMARPASQRTRRPRPRERPPCRRSARPAP